MPEEQLHGEEYMIMEEGGEREEREETDVSGNGDETFVAMTFTLPSEVINSARREATGGRIKRRVYGLKIKVDYIYASWWAYIKCFISTIYPRNSNI